MPGARRLTILALCLLPALAGVAKEPKEGRSAAAIPAKSTTGAMLRSLVVPGWGQAYNEQYVKALIFAAVQGTQLIQISRMHDKMIAAKQEDYHPERFEEDSPEWIAARSADARAGFEERRFRERRNKTVWWFAATLLLSLGDAYVDAHLYGLDISPELTYDRDTVAGLSVTVDL